MTRIDVAHSSIALESAMKYRGVLLRFGALAEEAIDQRHRLFDRIGAMRRGRERALQVTGYQRRANAFAGNVGDRHGPAIVGHAQDIEIITTYFERRYAASASLKPALRRQAARIQALLDLPRQLELLLHFLLAALLFEKARVFQDRGCFERQRLQELAITGGQVGGADPRIQVKDAHGLTGG